ncbi:MAG: DUF2760 domain-containing protein [Desulfobacter sp.]|nr:MAG: DUF2760 domain-containing protein [Desulfobacter sp.]
MDIIKVYRKKSFNVIVLWMLLLGAAISAGGYYGMDWFLRLFSSEDGLAMLNQSVPGAIEMVKLVFSNYYIWAVPCIIGVGGVFGMVGWLVLSFSISPSLKAAADEFEASRTERPGKKGFIDHKIEQERKRRLFLHTLSVLQREGRLLDFFDEDLSLYEDEQIGAAVRSIQEDCKKAIKKYIDLRPVVDGEEGDSITIEEGFDIDAINLVGNVSGQPPFQGIIKHPGWKAGKKDMPKLSDIQDPGIMTPAEIEIQQ